MVIVISRKDTHIKSCQTNQINMTKEQTKRDLYNNPEKTAFAMRPESETVYSQVCKLEQTGCWIDDFDKNFISGTEKGLRTAMTTGAIKDHEMQKVKQFISKTISQEREKWETEKKKHNVIHPQMVYLKHGLFNEYGELVMAIESATKAQGIAKQYNYTLKELY